MVLTLVNSPLGGFALDTQLRRSIIADDAGKRGCMIGRAVTIATVDRYQSLVMAI
jgi:hypothetical protein